MFIINVLKKSVTHIRKSVKFTLLILIAAIMIFALVAYFFKPTYSVTLNGEFIGYTKNKSQLQARINEAIQQGDGANVAFKQVDIMPEYQLCLLKRDVETNDDAIYDKVMEHSTTYYRYYAILEDGETKYYLATFDEAEDVLNQLKEKESTNSDKITIEEIYNTEIKEFAQVETCVNELYKQKPVVRVARTSSGSGIPPTSTNTSGKKVNLGISLIRPTAGVVTSRFGLRSRNNHKGIDIGAPAGTAIYAAAAGTVTVSSYGYNGGYGNYVIINHTNGVQTVYAHCSSLVATQGQYVSQGQLIARVGSTGNSTGNHLHLEIRVNGVAQNPQNYLY